MSDQKPSSNVNISADAVMGALNLLGAYVQSGTGVAGSIASSGGMTAIDQQNKVDVNVPELMTSINGMLLQMSANYQAAFNTVNLAQANQASFFRDLTNQMALDHRDQNHTKQALAATFPFVVAGDAAEESANDTDK